MYYSYYIKLFTRFSIFLNICEIYGFLNFYISDDKLKSKIYQNLQNYTFVLDNCRIHHSRCTDIFFNNHLDNLYLFFYPPFLNPIEEMFAY
jgi:hypothetical protein